jgi:hypothetical protein
MVSNNPLTSLFETSCLTGFSIMQSVIFLLKNITSVAVKSTFNWYWLVDRLQEHGCHLGLVNISAVKQYDGLNTAVAIMMPSILRTSCDWVFCQRGTSIRNSKEQ